MLRLLIFKDPNLCQWQNGPKFYARSNKVKGFTPCYGDVWGRGQLYKLSASAVDKAGWSATCSGSWVGAPHTHKMTGGWVGHTAGLDSKEEKILSLEYWSPTCSFTVYWLRLIYFEVCICKVLSRVCNIYLLAFKRHMTLYIETLYGNVWKNLKSLQN